MKEEKLKELLAKYYNGDSSLEEEMMLKEYFEGDIILPGYETEMEIFRHFRGSGTMSAPPDDLEMRIRESIDDLEKTRGKNFTIRWYFAMSGIAAVLLITIGFYFFFKHNAGPRDTFSDPVIAYAETMKVLNDISIKLNRGTQALKPIGKIESAARLSIESIDRSATLLTNSIKPIESISRLSDPSNKLNK